MRSRGDAIRFGLAVTFALALVAAPSILSLAGCAGGPAVSIEACYLDPEYGKICGVITRGPDGKYSVMVKADVTLPPEVRARFDKWAGSEISRLEAGDH